MKSKDKIEENFYCQIDRGKLKKKPRINSKGEQMKQIIAGGLSTLCSTMASHPLEMVKTRLQLQVRPVEYKDKKEPENSNEKLVKKDVTPVKYKSISHAFKVILKEEGFLAFWKGHRPAQLMSITFGVTTFWTYEQLRFLSTQYKFTNNLPYLSNFCSGAIGAGIACIITTPFDVIRTRLMAQKEYSGYKSTSHAIVDIARKEGLHGLYRGIPLSIAQTMAFMGLNFMFYEKLRKVAEHNDSTNLPVHELLMIGAISGALSKSIVSPLDLIKKRVQVQGFEEHLDPTNKHKAKCNNFWECLRLITKEEGVWRFAEGVIPLAIRGGYITAIQFFLYYTIVESL